tara:strand:+ start:191 stop:592 length:402 start_codon:yes stop_codon:yes gene_type:complete
MDERQHMIDASIRRNLGTFGVPKFVGGPGPSFSLRDSNALATNFWRENVASERKHRRAAGGPAPPVMALPHLAAPAAAPPAPAAAPPAMQPMPMGGMWAALPPGAVPQPSMGPVYYVPCYMVVPAPPPSGPAH